MMERRELIVGAAAATASLAQTPVSAPNTSSVMLWTLKGSFEEKLEAAAKAGIQSVELVGEHAEWTNADIDRVKKLTRSLKLGIDTISSTPFWGRMPISMVDPAQRDNLLKEVQKNIDAAQRLEIPMLLLMSGNAIPSKSYAEQWTSLVESTKRCGDLAAKANVTLIVEPLNTKVNHKGYFLDSCVGGVKLMKEADHPNIRLLFDLYHEQVQMGDVTRTLRDAMPYVKVFHIADNPGRNDPGTGEMNYPYLYKEIQKAGYKGYLTMEYIPLGDQVKSLIAAVDSMRKSLA